MEDQIQSLTRPDSLDFVTTERLLDEALARLSDTGATWNPIAAYHAGEALRQIRKDRPTCGGESDAR